MTTDPLTIPARRAWLGILARAEPTALEQHLRQAPPLPDFVFLRRPETGLSMVRGRTGGNGEAVNLIEATLTRASITDSQGHTGHGYVLGRAQAHAITVARLDAALQCPTRHTALMAAVVDPLAALERQRHADVEATAAGTEVRFFTMSTGRS
mgnify:CR=1 FL=1